MVLETLFRELMPTLFPPLEAEGDGDSILPADLRANFEALQAIIRAQSRLSNEQEVPVVIDGAQVRDKSGDDEGNNAAEGEDSRLANGRKSEGLESRKRNIAMATAVAVQSEISRLTNGIAELESLLLQQGTGVNSSEIEFPALPTVVIEEDVEEAQTKESGSSEVEDTDSKKEEMDILGQGKK